MENGPEMSRCISYIENEDIPASYVIVYQGVQVSNASYVKDSEIFCWFVDPPNYMDPKKP